MKSIYKLIALLGVLAISVGCAQDPKFKGPNAPEKEDEVTVTVPSPTPAELEDSDVQINIAGLNINLRESLSQVGELNNLPFVAKLDRVLCGDLYTDLIVAEISKHFSSNSLNNVCDVLFYMSGNEAGTTVGIGDKSDGSLEVVVSSLSEGLARSFNILINPDENGQLDLIDLVYFIDYYSNMAADLEYSEDTKICFDRNTLNIRCEEVSEEDVITSLVVTQSKNVVKSPAFPLNSINILIKWETEILDLANINIKIFEGSNLDAINVANNYSGQARNAFFMGLKPKTNHLIRLEATLADGSKSVRLLEIRTRGL